MNRKPNLFIIGAMKSGTTSLHHYLSTHPEIYMSPVKEPEYFSSRNYSTQTEKEYLKIFAQATNELYVGESSPGYTRMPFRKKVAQRIYNYSPQAKIIYIIREPFERMISQYKHMVRGHYEVRSLSEFVFDRYDSSLTNSYYAYQLRPYIDLFGRESVYIDTLEAFISSPQKFCQRLFFWLGVDGNFIPPNLNINYLSSPQQIEVIDTSHLIGWLVLKMARRKLFGRGFKWFPSKQFQSVVPKKTIDFKSDKFKLDVEKLKTALANTLNDWNSQLEEITGQSYSNWYFANNIDTAITPELENKLKEKLKQIS